MSKQIINEEMKIHEEWFKEARSVTLETLPAFLTKLTTEYGHDYGTICHAIVAAALGAAWAVDKTECGGITGFQAGAIMWGFIKRWNYTTNKLGLRLVDYDKLLYPQYADNFKNIISAEHWERIREEARRRLKESDFVAAVVAAHWQNIADGKLPFGFAIGED